MCEFIVIAAILPIVASEYILCREGWRHGSSQITLGGVVVVVVVVVCRFVIW